MLPFSFSPDALSFGGLLNIGVPRALPGRCPVATPAPPSHPLPQTSGAFCLLRILRSNSPDFLDFSSAPNPQVSAECPTDAWHTALPKPSSPSTDYVGPRGPLPWGSNARGQDSHPGGRGVSSLDAFYPALPQISWSRHVFPSHCSICPVLSGLAAVPWVRSLMACLSPGHPLSLHIVVRSQKSK